MPAFVCWLFISFDFPGLFNPGHGSLEKKGDWLNRGAVNFTWLMLQRDKVVRKSIHLLMGVAILLLSCYVSRQTLLILIAAGTVFAFASFQSRKFRFLHQTTDQSLGTLFYPLGVLTSFLLLYNLPLYYFQISLMTLTLSDTIAYLAGQIRPGNIRFNTFKEEKSLYGVLGFAGSTLGILYFFLPESRFGIHAYVILVVILAVNFEVISYKGSDNFSIPVGSALFFLIMEAHDSNLPLLIGVLGFAAIGSFFLYQWKVLTKNAAIAVYFLGVYFIGVLGLAWIVPVLVFFFTSVMLTRINTALGKKNPAANRRNAWQVLANIFWAVLFSAAYLINGNVLFVYFFIALVAAVTADTWSSEVGPVFHKNCFSLAHFKTRKAGISGGVSFAGTLAAVLASAVLSMLGVKLFFEESNTMLIAVLALSAFLSSVVDSLLGAFLEPTLMKVKIFRLRKAGARDYLSPNDVINLLGSFSAPIFFLLLRGLL